MTHFFKNSYPNILLLVFVFFIAFIIPIFPVSWHKVLYSFFFTLVFINATFVVEQNRKFNIIFAISSIVLDSLSNWLDLYILNNASLILSLGFFFYMVLMFILQISRSKIVDARVIAESIIGYLMLGIAFALIIAIVISIDPSSITFPSSAIEINSGYSAMSNFIYISIVTLSTLGYGDVLPTEPYTRSLMTFITVVGQFYMAILVALLIGKFSATIAEKNDING